MIAREIKNLDIIIYIIVPCNYSQISEAQLATIITQRYQGGRPTVAPAENLGT